MYPLVAKWTILPGNEEKAVAALQQLAIDVQEIEEGTLLYMVHVPDFTQTSLPTPPVGEVVFWEVYTDFDAFLTHINGKTFTNFVANYGNLFLQDFSNKVFMTTETLTQIGGFSRIANP